MNKHLPKNIVVTTLVIIAGISLFNYSSAEKKPTAKHAPDGGLVEHLTFDTFKASICDCGIDNGGPVQWKYKGTLPAVIDFYADWCGPCQIVSPVLEDLAREYKGRVKIYKVNTDANRELAAMFGIRGVPSMLFIPPAGKPRMSSGVLSKSDFKQAFVELLGVKEAAPM